MAAEKKVIISIYKKLTLSTSPYKKSTHWKQTLFYVENPFSIEEGDKIIGHIKTEKANDKVTAKGRPSGIATTIIVTAMIIYFKIYPISFPVFQPSGIISPSKSLIHRTMKIKIAEI